MKNKKDIEIQVRELFMAKADWNRCFKGTIKRLKDENGNPFVFSRIKVNQGYIYARESDQWTLGEMLDSMILMVLDYELHSKVGETIMLAGTPFFLN